MPVQQDLFGVPLEAAPGASDSVQPQEDGEERSGELSNVRAECPLQEKPTPDHVWNIDETGEDATRNFTVVAIPAEVDSNSNYLKN